MPDTTAWLVTNEVMSITHSMRILWYLLDLLPLQCQITLIQADYGREGCTRLRNDKCWLYQPFTILHLRLLLQRRQIPP